MNLAPKTLANHTTRAHTQLLVQNLVPQEASLNLVCLSCCPVLKNTAALDGKPALPQPASLLSSTTLHCMAACLGNQQQTWMNLLYNLVLHLCGSWRLPMHPTKEVQLSNKVQCSCFWFQPCYTVLQADEQSLQCCYYRTNLSAVTQKLIHASLKGTYTVQSCGAP